MKSVFDICFGFTWEFKSNMIKWCHLTAEP